MNEHMTFIVLSYGLGALVLGWTAISPLLRQRRLLKQLGQMNRP
jgi:heme exporter protein CcmD